MCIHIHVHLQIIYIYLHYLCTFMHMHIIYICAHLRVTCFDVMQHRPQQILKSCYKLSMVTRLALPQVDGVCVYVRECVCVYVRECVIV